MGLSVLSGAVLITIDRKCSTVRSYSPIVFEIVVTAWLTGGVSDNIYKVQSTFMVELQVLTYISPYYN